MPQYRNVYGAIGGTDALLDILSQRKEDELKAIADEERKQQQAFENEMKKRQVGVQEFDALTRRRRPENLTWNERVAMAYAQRRNKTIEELSDAELTEVSRLINPITPWMGQNSVWGTIATNRDPTSEDYLSWSIPGYGGGQGPRPGTTQLTGGGLGPPVSLTAPGGQAGTAPPTTGGPPPPAAGPAPPAPAGPPGAGAGRLPGGAPAPLPGQPIGNPLSAGQEDKLTGLEAQQPNLDIITKGLDDHPEWFGPAVGNAYWLRSKGGARFPGEEFLRGTLPYGEHLIPQLNPGRSNLDAALAGYGNYVIKLLGESQVPPQEEARIRSELPATTQNPIVARSRLIQTQRNVDQLKAIIRSQTQPGFGTPGYVAPRVPDRTTPPPAVNEEAAGGPPPPPAPTAGAATRRYNPVTKQVEPIGGGATAAGAGGAASPIEDVIRSAAAEQGLDPALALAVARRESNLNPAAVGQAGEIGTFQLRPGAAADTGVDRTDPAQNILGGVRYLKQLLTRYGGDLEKALMAYNGGPEGVDAGRPSPAAQAYAQAILAELGAARQRASGLPTGRQLMGRTRLLGRVP